MVESDLYPPLKSYLSDQGYDVKAEIQHCDVVAVRGDEPPVIIELKLNLNLTILLQAVDRLKLSPTVYIGIPHGLPVIKKQGKRIIKLIRMLGLGLLTIDVGSKIGNVNILCDPADYRPRQTKQRTHRLLAEFQHRVGDPNQGGTSMRKGIMTAYRQKAIAIATYLDSEGATKASVIANSLEEPKTRTILYDNVYGWFDRLGKGIYTLSPRGTSELPDWISKNKNS